MIEWIVILGVIFCIVVWYYSQSVAEYGFSQITERQVGLQLGDLWAEKKPVIVSDMRGMRLWESAGLRQTRFWDAQPIWADYQGNPEGAIIGNDHALQVTWAKILGIQQLETDRILGWFGVSPILFSGRTEAHIGAEGLRQTFGHATSYQVTEGEGRAVLLHSAQKNRLPPGWKGLRWRDATVAHHPLWTQVQFVEVILRPGTALLVPPHWIVAIEPMDMKKPIWWVRTDLHHPISSWAQWLNEK